MHADDTQLVHHRIAAQAVTRPDAVAVTHGPDSITYRELDRRADRLSAALGEAGAVPGTVVVADLERSIDLVVTFLAVLRAGGSYLPLDPATTPDRRVAAVVEQTGSPVAVSTADRTGLFGALGLTVVAPGSGPAGRPAVPAAVTGDDIAYVVYTSGSTGRPKGARIRHGSLARLCTAVTARYDLTPDDRVLQFAATSFDTSIEQILVTLVNGATLVLPEYQWAASELAAQLRRHRVTVMDLSPPYWRSFLSHLPGPVDDLPVRLTIVGGSAVDAGDCRAALATLPGSRLVNAYGLTETTVTSCTAELTARTLPESGPAPVGQPLPGTTVLVVDDDLAPVTGGHDGEVCLAGAGLAAGYVADPGGGAAGFATLPDGTRVYRTGDRGHVGADGQLVVTGRTDRQLKIRGYRVEPGEIEAVLRGLPGVTDAVVVPVPDGDGTALAAYLAAGDAVDLRSAGTRGFLAARLPAFMIPSRLVTLDALPTTAHGKVDVEALPEPGPLHTAAPEPGPPSGGSRVEQAVAKLWAQVLDVAHVDAGDDFFGLGGDSTRAAELMAKLRATLGVQITQVRPLIKLLLADATLRGFAAAVEQARIGALADPGQARIDFAAESRLDVPITGTPDAACDPARPRTVLLTGATGFLGIYLLRELLATTDAVVHCLVRAADEHAALGRVRDTALHYVGDDLADAVDAGRIVGLVGDLAEPLLGLDETTFDELARTVDVIHHPGGTVNFIYPYSYLRAANVAGTREIVRLAGRYRNAPVHYTSTMAVVSGFGTAGTHAVTEDTPLDHPENLAVGYVESKWVAEQILGEAARAGLPVAIYRAADISGDQHRGAWNTATEMCAMKRFVVDSGVAPIAELPLDYTPVDVFAAAVAHIAAAGRPRGEVYHLTNPGKVNVSELVGRMRARGYRIDEIGWEQWVDRLITLAVEEPDHPMTPFAPLFIDREPTGRMAVADMYLEDTFPAFTRTNVDDALRGSGIAVPPVDAAMLDRYLDYLISIEFLGEPA